MSMKNQVNQSEGKTYKDNEDVNNPTCQRMVSPFNDGCVVRCGHDAGQPLYLTQLGVILIVKQTTAQQRQDF